MDDVIAVYKRDVDVTLLDEALKLMVEERIRRLQDLGGFVEEMRAAMERMRGGVG